MEKRVFIVTSSFWLQNKIWKLPNYVFFSFIVFFLFIKNMEEFFMALESGRIYYKVCNKKRNRTNRKNSNRLEGSIFSNLGNLFSHIGMRRPYTGIYGNVFWRILSSERCCHNRPLERLNTQWRKNKLTKISDESL